MTLSLPMIVLQRVGNQEPLLRSSLRQSNAPCSLSASE
jgi:hypothetical protein